MFQLNPLIYRSLAPWTGDLFFDDTCSWMRQRSRLRQVTVAVDVSRFDGRSLSREEVPVVEMGGVGGTSTSSQRYGITRLYSFGIIGYSKLNEANMAWAATVMEKMAKT